MSFCLTLFHNPAASSTDATAPYVIEYFRTRAIILASLLVRGRNELDLHNHRAEGGMKTIVRREQIQFLRECGLWGALEPAELGLISAADGNWAPEQLNHLPQWCEQLRVLRWVLKIDTYLLPLSRHPNLDFSVAGSIAKNGDAIRCKVSLQPLDIRPVRDLAYAYTLSVALEMSRRGLIHPTERLEEKEREMRVGFFQKRGDFVVNGSYLWELENEELWSLFHVACIRHSYCQYIIDQLSANGVRPYQFSGRPNLVIGGVLEQSPKSEISSKSGLI